MNISKQEWDSRIEAARTSLDIAPHFDLDGVHVMRILSLFGPRLDLEDINSASLSHEQADPDALRGWQCRAWNSLLCAEKVVDLCRPFTSKYGIQTDLRAIINEAKELVLDKQPQKLGQILSDHGFADSDNLFYGRSDERAVSKAMDQAMSAYVIVEHAISVVCYDVEAVFDLDKEEWEELDADIWNIPTCIFTSRTIGGFYYQPAPLFIDDVARREFWLWWLDVSLPASLNLQTPSLEGENQ